MISRASVCFAIITIASCARAPDARPTTVTLVTPGPEPEPGTGPEPAGSATPRESSLPERDACDESYEETIEESCSKIETDCDGSDPNCDSRLLLGARDACYAQADFNRRGCKCSRPDAKPEECDTLDPEEE